ncbi:AcrR family transcriptional regulator [Elusimicrobium simillimum]|uniref:TetR/AcrR family transcriptional regulator n=1 Tax=Elusimicrobium simillimum TaxID=3143438 RepID=UPI003C704CBC
MKQTKTTIKHDKRKNEILDIAENLFTTKGYEKTTVENIINTAVIAKGTFYHYFKSKEELLDAIIMRFMDVGVKIIQSIADDPKLTAEQKLHKVTTFKYHKSTPNAGP